MAVISIREIDRADIKQFVTFPFKIYRTCKYWVPPLIPDDMKTFSRENPAFEYCRVKFFMAYKDGEPAGRIAGIINEKYIEKWNNNYMRFGWIDFIEDRDVAFGLLEAVEQWARAEKMKAVNGPLGFTDLDPEGMLIEGFDEMGTLPMIYNYSYYPQYLEEYGYRKDVDWYEFEVNVPDSIPPKIERVRDIVLEKTGVRLLETQKRKELLDYVPGIFDVINESYNDLYGVVELNEKQVNFYTEQYFSFIDPDFVPILLDESNEVAGFGIAMPSLSRALQRAGGKILPFGFIHLLLAMKFPSQIDLYLVGVKNKYKNMGLNAVLMAYMIETCIKRGIKSAETSGELETNKRVQSFWKYFERRHHKTRRCYIKYLE